MLINMNFGILLLAIVILMITLGGSGCASTSYTVPKTVVDDASLPRIEINGVLLHSRTFGNPNSPVVIVLHGGPGWDSRYLLSIQALKDEFFVVFYDQRGAGLSQRVPDEQLTYKVMMEDLDAVVGHYGKGRKVSLIGHSWGAMLASLYLAQYPDKLAGVVIAASGPMTGEIADRLKWPFSIGFVFHAGWNWFGSLFVHEPDEYATDDYFYYQLFATYEGPGHPLAKYHCGDTVLADDYSVWRFGGRALNEVTATYSGSREGWPRIDFTQGVENFDQEVLFMAGACDSILGPEVQREHMRPFPDARLVVIENAGHDIFTEQPVTSLIPVRAYLQAFINNDQ